VSLIQIYCEVTHGVFWN